MKAKDALRNVYVVGVWGAALLTFSGFISAASAQDRGNGGGYKMAVLTRYLSWRSVSTRAPIGAVQG